MADSTDKSYLSFLWSCARVSLTGGARFYTWMFLLSAIGLVGLDAYGTQLNDGMAVTNMSDHVSWGLYIANFTFGVGLAAGAVLMVIPAYLYGDKEMHDVVIIGEIVAIVSMLMCLLFVTVDLGNPLKFWHMMPGIGEFNWPISMLSWDVLVLNGYLLINLHVTGYLIYTRYRGLKPNPRWYVPFVFLSIFWAISIHTVTAFLYSGLGGRPFWNTAILAPRFIISAFVSGPAFIIIILHLLQRTKQSVLPNFRVTDAPIKTLASFLRVTVIVNLFLLLSEVFTHFYTGGHHAISSEYLFFGLGEANALVPWIWTGVFLNVVAALLLLFGRRPDGSMKRKLLLIACVMTFGGVWIEKGMGLIIPAFIPSTLGEIVEYTPSMTEWKITAGIWAFGLGLLTIGVRVMSYMFNQGTEQK